MFSVECIFICLKICQPDHLNEMSEIGDLESLKEMIFMCEKINHCGIIYFLNFKVFLLLNMLVQSCLIYVVLMFDNPFKLRQSM